jgi:hypothetical protein
MVYETETIALEKLAAELGARRYTTKLQIPEGQRSARPALEVRNPLAPISETVYAGHGWYWWSWAERIAPAENASAAADAVARVLAEWRSST